jgi:hypothetical protein
MTNKTLAKLETKKSYSSQKSNLKSIWGSMKGKIIETNDCWIEDLEKTIKF